MKFTSIFFPVSESFFDLSKIQIRFRNEIDLKKFFDTQTTLFIQEDILNEKTHYICTELQTKKNV